MMDHAPPVPPVVEEIGSPPKAASVKRRRCLITRCAPFTGSHERRLEAEAGG